MGNNAEEANLIILKARAEADEIIRIANEEAQRIVANMERTNRGNDSYCRDKIAEADEKAKIMIEDAELVCKGWMTRGDKYMTMVNQEKDRLLNGLNEHHFLMEIERYGCTPEKIQEYLTTLEDPYFRNNLDLLNLKMKECRQANEAVTIKETVNWHNRHRKELEHIASFCLAYFDVISKGIIQNAHKYDLNKSISNILNLKHTIEISLWGIGIEISQKYVDYKIEALRTKFVYEEYKQRRKEEISAERERIRDEEKSQKEYERIIRQAEKDEVRTRREIDAARRKLIEEQENEVRHQELLERIRILESSLEEAIKRGERAISMAQQTRRGYVYIISNVGSFGENMYKIGLTRRFDPTERIDELSNASVPFPFDIHAIIESEDAPALETALHKAFEKQKVNQANWRKEFFHVSIDEIEKVVKASGVDAAFLKQVPAKEYRDTEFYKRMMIQTNDSTKK